MGFKTRVQVYQDLYTPWLKLPRISSAKSYDLAELTPGNFSLRNRLGWSYPGEAGPGGNCGLLHKQLLDYVQSGINSPVLSIRQWNKIQFVTICPFCTRLSCTCKRTRDSVGNGTWTVRYWRMTWRTTSGYDRSRRCCCCS